LILFQAFQPFYAIAGLLSNGIDGRWRQEMNLPNRLAGCMEQRFEISGQGERPGHESSLEVIPTRNGRFEQGR
jgi:hypothetical protein